METIFIHFLRQESIAVSGSSFSFNSNTFFGQFIPASGSEFFICWKQYFFISSFFLLMETIIEIWRKSVFKDES